MDDKLTKEEKEILLKIATRIGCDKDGDILLFFVRLNENIVELR